MMKKKFKLLFFFIFIGSSLVAQDIHFSQFFNSPLNLNPALTGNFDGNKRFVFNGREQWSSVTVPFITTGLSADFSQFRKLPNTAAGISILNDRAGSSHFNTFQVNISAAYIHYFDKKKKESLAFGFQTGITQKSINYTKLRYDEQYNGSYFDPNLPITEQFATNTRLYPNLNLGVHYKIAPGKRRISNFGAGFFNLNTPSQSFKKTDNIRLDRRMNLYYTGLYKWKGHTDILPAISFMQQGKYRELVIGSGIRYTLDPNPGHFKAVHAGIYTRFLDAFFITGGMEIKDWYWCVSYDFNYSKLVPASRVRGGLEISVIYILKSLPERLKFKACPAYM